jgi:rod shape-determining protein MreC
MAVIAPAGVVGRVIMPSARAAKVQLLIDSNAAAGAMVERTRAQGVAVGTGTDRLQMDYVPAAPT